MGADAYRQRHEPSAVARRSEHAEAGRLMTGRRHTDQYVCAHCFSDAGLSDYIRRYAKVSECSFCGSQSTEPIAVSLAELCRHMRECLHREYDDAANWLGFCSAEGGYQGETWDTWDLLVDELELELPEVGNDRLLAALVDRIGMTDWCKADPYGLDPEEHTRYSWQRFCNTVKHERRYFFTDGDDGDPEVLSPAEMLYAILANAYRLGLCRTYRAAELKLVRARYQPKGKQWRTAGELGPPPRRHAVLANRMSPAGIPMFYGSLEVETALSEIATADRLGRYAIGTFANTRAVRILDLTSIPAMPSLFAEVADSAEYDRRATVQFMREVARAMSQPVEKDGREHIEYVPSQVVTEFVRSRGVGKSTVDGIAYASAVHAGGVSYVLFADQGNLVGGEDARYSNRDQWLELTGHRQRSVSAEDVARWQAM